MDLSENIEKLIESAATKHGLDYDIVRAVVVTESNGDTWAVRFEKKWRWFLNPMTYARLVNVSKATETVCQQMSWGLMQVMGTVARELGHKGDLTQLCDPAIGLDLGCKKLSQLNTKYNNIFAALSAYNTGRPYSHQGSIYGSKVKSNIKRRTI